MTPNKIGLNLEHKTLMHYLELKQRSWNNILSWILRHQKKLKVSWMRVSDVVYWLKMNNMNSLIIHIFIALRSRYNYKKQNRAKRRKTTGDSTSNDIENNNVNTNVDTTTTKK
jgi:hypothetical protein